MVRNKDHWKSWRARGFLEREDLKEVERNGKKRREMSLEVARVSLFPTTGVRNTWGVLF